MLSPRFDDNVIGTATPVDLLKFVACISALVGLLLLLAFACGTDAQEKETSASVQTATPETSPTPDAPTHDGRLQVLRSTQCFELLDVYPTQPNRSHIITHTYTTEDIAHCIAQDCTLNNSDCGTWTATDWRTFIPWMLAHCANPSEGNIHDHCYEGGSVASQRLRTLLAH